MIEWKRIKRKNIYDTKFVKLYEDTIELPNGQVFDDYSIIKFPDSVVIVATDNNDNLLLFKEYKYAINEHIFSFPAGGIEPGQTPVEAALRELEEETGYTAEETEVVGVSNDYPSKVQHTDYIVRIKNARKEKDIKHENTEFIGVVQALSKSEVNKLWSKGKLKASYMVVALAHTFPELLAKKN